MKKTIIKYSFTVFILFLIIACSVKKDKFVNRNFHAVTTEYNILYNGNISLDEGVTSLVETFKDNFWELLPVEQMPEIEDNFLPGQTKNPVFGRAEEKAVKAIQKHSMNIEGREKNPQMDEAYLLLAKARYYDNRFIPALEALNYILYKYPQSDKIYHAKVWREKVNIRIDNNEVAIDNLKELLEKKNIKGQDLSDANAMLTQAYINLGHKDSAIATIKIAKEASQSKEQRARYSFILGQLYEDFQYSDSAFATYQDVIDLKRKSPRRYVIQAHAKQAMQFDYEKGDTLVFLEKFNKLLEDRENRPFLDVLNHQMGIFYDKQNKDNQAIGYYNKSIKNYISDDYLISSNYRNIGEIYFKKAKYQTAGKYYDSTLIRLDNKSREFRKIKKKRENLVDVIKYETIAQVNDSILAVVNMNDNERSAFYSDYISKLKVADDLKAQKEKETKEKEANAIANNSISGNSASGGINNSTSSKMSPGNFPSGFPSPANMGGIDDQASSFYFYNPTTVAFGKQEFVKKWGKRKLVDNWRLKSLAGNSSDIVNNNSEAIKDSIVIAESDPKYEVSYYTKQIPTDLKVIDSLTTDRNFAYYQLGVLYKEKFKEYQLAANRLEKLLQYSPEERLVLPAKYNLFKIYEIIDPAKATLFKNQIISEYPNSRYAQIVANPSTILSDEDNPEVVYKKLYKAYESGLIRETFNAVNEKTYQYIGDESLPKFELLKANILGRLEGVETFKNALNFVALTYPDSPEGKQAENLLQVNIPKLEAIDFNQEVPNSWKLIFPKKNSSVAEIENLTKILNSFLKDMNNTDLKLSTDVYNLQEDIIVIHGFLTPELAKSAMSLLKDYKKYKIKDTVYVVSNEDYKVIQAKKKLQQWLNL